MEKVDTNETRRILTELGLHDKEASIYLACLQLGSGTVSEVAEAGKIERSGIYYHIDNLLAKGLLKTASKGKRTVYLPVDPEKFNIIAETTQKHLLKILPGLQEQFARDISKSIIESFQGQEEVSAFYDRLYQLLSSLDAPNNNVAIFGQTYRDVTAKSPMFCKFKRPERQIDVHVRAIIARSSKSKDPKENAMDPYIVTRYNLPRAELKYIDDKYLYPSAIVIVGTKVAFVDFSNFFYTITENANIAATYRMFFQFTWDHLK